MSRRRARERGRQVRISFERCRALNAKRGGDRATRSNLGLQSMVWTIRVVDARRFYCFRRNYEMKRDSRRLHNRHNRRKRRRAFALAFAPRDLTSTPRRLAGGRRRQSRVGGGGVSALMDRGAASAANNVMSPPPPLLLRDATTSLGLRRLLFHTRRRARHHKKTTSTRRRAQAASTTTTTTSRELVELESATAAARILVTREGKSRRALSSINREPECAMRRESESSPRALAHARASPKAAHNRRFFARKFIIVYFVV